MKEVRALLESQGFDASSLRALAGRGRSAIVGLTVPGEDALSDCRLLREAAPAAGLWPVLVGRDGQDGLRERLRGRERTAEQILAEAEGLDFPAWVESRYAAVVAGVRGELESAERGGFEEDAEMFRGMLDPPEPWKCLRRADWPRYTEPTQAWEIAHAMTHDGGAEVPVTLALVPARHGWEALAALDFGRYWRHRPQAVNVAAFRHWEQAHGAAVVSVTEDEIWAEVARPPQTRGEALALARAQALYCDDIETQVYKSVDMLAAKLLGGEGWYFWWD